MRDKKVSSPAMAEDLLYAHYTAWQRDLEAKGQIPRSKEPFISKRRSWLELAGTVPLALLVTGFTLFANFIILVLIFHLEI